MLIKIIRSIKVSFSPILLFAYKRLSHLERTVKALQQNTLASKSLLYIYSDGPRNDNDIEQVQAVRNFCSTITGFLSVTIIERGQNWGLSRSIIDGVSHILNSYDRVIVLEDDLETDKYFLEFMNNGLELFKNDLRVLTVQGYSYPGVENRAGEPFFLPKNNSWGWATWARAWKLVDFDANNLRAELISRRLIWRFNVNGAYDFWGILNAYIAGKNDSWAIRWMASEFLRGGLSLYPPYSLVHNIGHDGTGVHCGIQLNYDIKLKHCYVTVPENLKVKIAVIMYEKYRIFHTSITGIDYWYQIKRPVMKKIWKMRGILKHWLQSGGLL